MFTLEQRTLCCNGERLLEGVADAITGEPDVLGCGVFLVARAQQTHSRHVFELGDIPELECFTLCHRYEPYWMKPAAGTRLSEVPAETQYLLARLRNGSWLLLVPLIGELFRFSIQAARGGFSPSAACLERLELLAETGDAFSVGLGGLAVFVAVGSDPFELMPRAARSVAARLDTGRLRRDKPLPEFANFFGWCTWDAFYQEVSQQKLCEGLARFADGGVEPRWLILDDGWQSVQRKPTGEQRLSAFSANHKFPGGLAETVRTAKREFKIRWFFVWHAMVGYWGGVDGESLPGYGVRDQIRRFGEGILTHRPTFNEQWWGSLVGLVPAESIARFFDDYHRQLAAEGVDGVKVDSQAVLEGVAQGEGGRVVLSLAYRQALEASTEQHFDHRLINCMSNGQETWYAGRTSTLLRSSIDFFPRFPESHGAHLYANAQVGVWFGEFMQPDWDMFQSGHEWGAYHAAGRVVSGGPLYVSDKPGEHDFALLERLVCSDGRVLRCDQPGLPTLDTLCTDPTRERVLLKIWNRVGEAALVGAFNARFTTEPETPLGGSVGPGDVPGLGGGEFACFAARSGTLTRLAIGERVEVTLRHAEFELFTLVPIHHGFAALGLMDKLNSVGAIVEQSLEQNTEQSAQQNATSEARAVTLRSVVLWDGGTFLAWSETEPSVVECNGVRIAHSYDALSRRLEVRLPVGGIRRLLIHTSA